jgi:metalloendopeptidase OMA1, mitochondrial
MPARIAIGTAFVFSLQGCAWVTARLPEVVRDKISNAARDKMQRQVVDQSIDRLGVAAFEARSSTVRLSRARKQQELAQRVITRLASAADGTDWAATARGFAWEARVVEDDRVDAVAFPGGKVLVNAAVFNFTGKNEDELAAVLGHEVTHALARHVAERLGRDLESELLDPATYERLASLSYSNAKKARIMAAFGVAHAGHEVMPFTREQEAQADREGLLLMARAGYDPEAAVRFWTRMQAKDRRRRWPEALSLHPGYDTRIARLGDAMSAARALYEAAGRAVARGPRP